MIPSFTFIGWFERKFRYLSEFVGFRKTLVFGCPFSRITKASKNGKAGTEEDGKGKEETDEEGRIEEEEEEARKNRKKRRRRRKDGNTRRLKKRKWRKKKEEKEKQKKKTEEIGKKKNKKKKENINREHNEFEAKHKFKEAHFLVTV
uniref:Uncharacterized protein n=1 Tax=Trichuris muris TaxID=70415 RepID=A0A5S6QT83_TRIMR